MKCRRMTHGMFMCFHGGTRWTGLRNFQKKNKWARRQCFFFPLLALRSVPVCTNPRHTARLLQETNTKGYNSANSKMNYKKFTFKVGYKNNSVNNPSWTCLSSVSVWLEQSCLFLPSSCICTCLNSLWHSCSFTNLNWCLEGVKKGAKGKFIKGFQATKINVIHSFFA